MGGKSQGNWLMCCQLFSASPWGDWSPSTLTVIIDHDVPVHSLFLIDMHMNSARCFGTRSFDWAPHHRRHSLRRVGWAPRWYLICPPSPDSRWGRCTMHGWVVLAGFQNGEGKTQGRGGGAPRLAFEKKKYVGTYRTPAVTEDMHRPLNERSSPYHVDSEVRSLAMQWRVDVVHSQDLPCASTPSHWAACGLQNGTGCRHFTQHDCFFKTCICTSPNTKSALSNWCLSSLTYTCAWQVPVTAVISALVLALLANGNVLCCPYIHYRYRTNIVKAKSHSRYWCFIQSCICLSAVSSERWDGTGELVTHAFQRACATCLLYI